MNADKTPKEHGAAPDDDGDTNWRSTQVVAFDRHRALRKVDQVVLGRRIQELRLAKRWSQAELARAAGLYKNLVNTTERGLSLPRRENLVAIAAALGVTVESLTDIYYEDGTKAQAHPTVSAVEIPGRPELTWLTINRPVRLGTAGKIYAILDEDDAHTLNLPVNRG